VTFVHLRIGYRDTNCALGTSFREHWAVDWPNRNRSADQASPHICKLCQKWVKYSQTIWCPHGVEGIGDSERQSCTPWPNLVVVQAGGHKPCGPVRLFQRSRWQRAKESWARFHSDDWRIPPLPIRLRSASPRLTAHRRVHGDALFWFSRTISSARSGENASRKVRLGIRRNARYAGRTISVFDSQRTSRTGGNEAVGNTPR